MFRIIPLLALLLIGYLAYKRYAQLEPKQRQQWLKKFGVTIFLALVLFALLTGRLNWIGALIMGALPFLNKMWTLFWQGKALKSWWDKQQGNSAMQSQGLILSFDQGALDGEIKIGKQAGKFLSQLNESELDALFQEFSRQDKAAAGLLQIYLVHRFGQHWQGSPLNQTGPSSDMSVEEARALLGVTATADKKTIVNAHRKLIQKFHPDRGGNDYLAARLNLAKDLLLKNINDQNG